MTPRASIIIPAHNEETVIDRCLKALLDDALPDEFDVIVVANGCSDATAQVARRRGVTVVVVAAAGKTFAINAGDAKAKCFPRIYLDADVEVTTSTARKLVDALTGTTSATLAAGARPVVATGATSRLARWYYEVWEKLPVFDDSYVGSGVFAVSQGGHGRILPFPEVIADDLFVRRSFTRSERTTIDVDVIIHPARNLRALFHRAVRVRAGINQLARSGGLPAETSDVGLRGLSRTRSVTWYKTVLFVLVSVVIRAGAVVKRLAGREAVWNKDQSSRDSSPTSRKLFS